MIRAILLAPILTLLVVTGCANTQNTESKASPGMVNSACPMSQKALSADCPKSTWDGVTLGFCGPGCKAAFDNQTPAEKNAEVAALKAGTTSVENNGMVSNVCPMSSRKLASNSPTSTWDGKTIGFCCNGCKGRFDNMSDSEKNAMVASLNTAN